MEEGEVCVAVLDNIVPAVLVEKILNEIHVM
jgi:hypothetical protein